MIAIITFIIGFALGMWARGTSAETCPRAVLGYDCKGNTCDHDELLLRRNQVRMLEVAKEKKK